MHRRKRDNKFLMVQEFAKQVWTRRGVEGWGMEVWTRGVDQMWGVGHGLRRMDPGCELYVWTGARVISIQQQSAQVSA